MPPLYQISMIDVASTIDYLKKEFDVRVMNSPRAKWVLAHDSSPSPLQVVECVHMRLSPSPNIEVGGLPPNRWLHMEVEGDIDDHLLFVPNRPPSQRHGPSQHIVMGDNNQLVSNIHTDKSSSKVDNMSIFHLRLCLVVVFFLFAWAYCLRCHVICRLRKIGSAPTCLVLMLVPV